MEGDGVVNGSLWKNHCRPWWKETCLSQRVLVVCFVAKLKALRFGAARCSPITQKVMQSLGG